MKAIPAFVMGLVLGFVAKNGSVPGGKKSDMIRLEQWPGFLLMLGGVILIAAIVIFALCAYDKREDERKSGNDGVFKLSGE